MARPKSIDDEEILEAARDVFRKEGIQATTADVAQRAGISEGTIYRRFASKNELFAAAMDIPDPPPWVETIRDVDAADDLDEELHDISLEVLDFFEEVLPKVTMLTSNLGEENLFEAKGSAPPIRALKPMTRFFERERKRGRIRNCDPEVVARMFLGALQHFAFSEISGINDILPMPRETYVRGFIQTLLDGVARESADSE